MDDSTLTPAAERLLQAAMALFAAQGYERTTVGEIQEAAGLTFGSGALYKHFASKEALLTTGIERFVAHARSQAELLDGLDDQPLDQALAAMARGAMASFARDADLLRIAWRDLEPFPALQERVRTGRIRAAFNDFGGWLGQQKAKGRVTAADPKAVAAVALSSLAFFQLLTHLLHDSPGGLSEKRFVAAWAEIFAGALA